MRLVDVHCHLESEYFSETLPSIIDEAAIAGIVKLITSSITPPEWEVSAKIARTYPSVECALGVHPWYCSADDIPLLDRLREARTMGAVAIGEIGLDRKVSNPPFDLQMRIFEMQLLIAREVDLPVVLHCRGAFDELRSLLRKYGLPQRGGFIHSFSGSAEIAADFSRHGMSFSFGGALTYRNSKKKEEVLRLVYPDRFLLETDSPDIPPVEARDMPNVPANILYNLKAASDILGIAENEIAETSTTNAVHIFGLDI
jgi:TatD DNase family protein